MAKAKKPERIIKIDAYLVLNGGDEAYNMPIAEVMQDFRDEMFGADELQELTLTEVDAVVTKQGIRRVQKDQPVRSMGGLR